MYVWIYFWSLCPVPVTCASRSMRLHTVWVPTALHRINSLRSGSVTPPALLCFLKKEEQSFPSFVFLLAIQGLLWFHKNCRIICSISVLKSSIGVLIEIALNLQMALGRMAIVSALILPVPEHRISFHSSWLLQSLSSVAYSVRCRPFTSSVNYIPGPLFSRDFSGGKPRSRWKEVHVHSRLTLYFIHRGTQVHGRFQARVSVGCK